MPTTQFRRLRRAFLLQQWRGLGCPCGRGLFGICLIRCWPWRIYTFVRLVRTIAHIDGLSSSARFKELCSAIRRWRLARRYLRMSQEQQEAFERRVLAAQQRNLH